MSSVPTLPVHVITAASAVQLWKLCDFRHIFLWCLALHSGKWQLSWQPSAFNYISSIVCDRILA